ncbi:peroxisomal membrane protein-domain-containing protein [Aspergillus ambiguus]|uniref:peroxisomal membrane protein-domain-containing protein n=1 Tax=Aspergillus ambiguus TaxID=176160 RepID=UPI003CCE3B7F
MDTLSRLHTSINQNLANAFETATKDLKAELVHHDVRAREAEERAQLAEEARDTSSAEIETLREEVQALRENLGRKDADLDALNCQLEEAQPPLPFADREGPSRRELDEMDHQSLVDQYITLYHDARTLKDLFKRQKRKLVKLVDLEKLLYRQEFKLTRVHGFMDGIQDPGTSNLRYGERSHTDLSELASTQSDSSPIGGTTTEAHTPSGPLKRKRTEQQKHSGRSCHNKSAQEAIEPVTIKNESSPTSPLPTAPGFIETQDLDDVGDAVETPTKKRSRTSSQNQHIAQSPLKRRQRQEHSIESNRTPARRPTILQPVDSNLPVNSRRTDKPVAKSSEKAKKKYALSMLAEDGDENSLDLCARGRSTNLLSPTKPRHTTPATAKVSIEGRLDHLLAQPLPPRQHLLSPRKGRTKITAYRPDLPPAQVLRRNANQGKDSTTKTTPFPHKADAEPLSVVPDDEPYRCRPLHRLELNHFKINPDHNQGLNFAFNEVVRKKDERKCLSGCMRPGCCGDKFRAMARLEQISPEEAQKILEDYMGDDKHLHAGLSEEERMALLEEAKAKRLANSIGKHRHNHQRPGTPPGFWRTDMPDTQELEHDREEAMKLEREKVMERYREAMRPGGMWKFADDRVLAGKHVLWGSLTYPDVTSLSPYLLICYLFLTMESAWNTKAQVPPALWQPSKWLPMYEDFVTKNASTVGQVESALRSLTYIIPGRYRDSEISSECVHSGVQLLSLYHDSLVSKVISRLPPTVPRPTPTPHSRYTKYWQSKSSLYHRVALTLQMVQYTELLWEMIARRRGEKVRWRIVVLIEVVKAICRLFLLRLTNSRPLVSPPLPEREVDPRSTEEEESDWNGMQTPVSESSDLSWTMPRTGLSLPTLPDVNDVSNYLISKVLTADDIKPPKTLLHRVTGQGQLAEVLYILRPVIYALAMQRWSGDKRSWRPWLIGFGMEYGCRQLAKSDFRERVAGGLRGLTGLEREELRKRGWAMGWWFMRGAFYENITQPWLKGLTGKMKGKPILDLIGSVVEDYEYLWDNFYFPTATL